MSAKPMICQINDNDKKVVVYGLGIEGTSRQVLVWKDEGTRRNHAIFHLAEITGGLDTLLEAPIAFCRGEMRTRDLDGSILIATWNIKLSRP